MKSRARARAAAVAVIALGAMFASGCEVGTVTRVVDGDTIELGEVTVRVLGIDTPEEGQCGYAEAKARMTEIVQNREVVLGSDPGAGDADQYGRKLRYVVVRETNGTTNDVGLVLIREGHAHARYDAFDGYGPHRNQNSYRFADAAFTSPCDPPSAVPAPGPQPPGVYYPNCVAVRAAGAAPIYRGQPGYGSHLDRDGDGIACET